MTQDTHTLTIRSTSSSPGIEGSFVHWIERLQRLPARKLSPFLKADGEDLQDRADCLRIWLRATAQFVSEYAKDTADHNWHVEFDRRNFDNCFDDLIGDLCGAIERAADKTRLEDTYRAA